MQRARTLASLAALALSAVLPGQQPDPALPDGYEVLGTQVRFESRGQAPAYRVSEDGGRSFGEARAVEPVLKLVYQDFDPLAGEPPVPGLLTARADGRLWVVQYHTVELEAYRRTLAALGIEVHQSLPFQASILRMDPGLAGKLRSLPFVRWVGPYQPAWRLEGRIRDELGRWHDRYPAREYNIVMIDCDRDRAGLTQEIAQAAGRLAPDQVGHLYLTASLSRPQLLALASSDRVLWIDVTGRAEEDMDIVRAFGGANYVETQTGFTGKGVRGHIFEGIVAGHQEFTATPPHRAAPIAYLNAASNSHGSATFGVIFAKGVVAKARGMLPDGQGLYTNYSGINRYNCVGDLVNPTKGLEAMFQTASWGYSRTTSYLSTSAEMDKIILDWDLPITQSQSNAGSTSQPRDSRPQAWAKNIISIGGIRHYDTLTPADDKWLGAGSIGPADDGRIKPDLCSFYDSTYTTYSSSTTGYSNFSGTSNATPVNAGHVGLSLEMFTSGIFGHPAATWQKRFAARPHAQTTKAMMINSAKQYPFSGTTHDLTRVHQGWGHPHVGILYDRADGTLIVDEDDVLTQGAGYRYYVMVAGNQGELKFTMCYRDVEGTTSSSLHRINDLDLRVTDPNGTVYHGNNGLLAANYSTPGGTRNSVDTVENVFIASPTAGVWTVDVTAPTVTRDTHAATSAVDATFALVASGLRGLRDTGGPRLTLASQGKGDLSFKLENLPKGYTEGWTFLSLSTQRAPGHGDFLGVRFDALVATILGWPSTAGDPLHFPATTNANQFPNVPFQIPAGALLVLKGLSLDGVTLFVDANGPLDVSNVSRVDL